MFDPVDWGALAVESDKELSIYVALECPRMDNGAPPPPFCLLWWPDRAPPPLCTSAPVLPSPHPPWWLGGARGAQTFTFGLRSSRSALGVGHSATYPATTVPESELWVTHRSRQRAV